MHHQGPHGLILADDEGEEEVAIGGIEGAQGDHGKDGFGELERELPKKAEFSGAVQHSAFVDFLGQAIEEALEQKDEVAVCSGGQYQSPEGIEQIEFLEHEEVGDGHHHCREGHGEHEEHDDLVAEAWFEAGKRIGGQGIDRDGKQDGEQHIDGGIAQGVGIAEHLFQSHFVVAGDKFLSDGALSIFEAVVVYLLAGEANLLPVWQVHVPGKVE